MTNTQPGGALATLTQTLASKLDMGDGAGLIDTLKATAFKSQVQVSDAQMTALLVVANQFALNPWTKEIYAFPDKNNGIVPVVGVDGWSRIINTHPQFDGIDFEQDAASCTCVIYRKDRSHPIKVTEWMSECKRGTGPWQSHPRRMLLHKAMIQCARLAFGYGGIYDQDEAERIVEVSDRTVIDNGTGEILPRRAAPPAFYDAAQFEANFPKWSAVIASGRKSAHELIAFIEAKGNPLTEEHKARLLSVKRAATAATATGDADVIDVQARPVPAAAPVKTYAQVADALNAATTHEELDAAEAGIAAVADPGQQSELRALAGQRRDQMAPF